MGRGYFQAFATAALRWKKSGEINNKAAQPSLVSSQTSLRGANIRLVDISSLHGHCAGTHHAERASRIAQLCLIRGNLLTLMQEPASAQVRDEVHNTWQRGWSAVSYLRSYSETCACFNILDTCNASRTYARPQTGWLNAGKSQPYSDWTSGSTL